MENHDTAPPPPIIHEKFRYQNFSETRKGFPTKCFGTVKQQFRPKIVIPAPSLILNIFRYQKFSEIKKGSSTKCSGTVRQKIFDGES